MTARSLREGGIIFLQGLLKKRLIADRLSISAEAIFASPELFTSETVWWGLIAYSVQIYCDFSGYSDMAIGSARILGYELPENFNMPYLSTSITEFWRRWHITLSAWLRDYLYIPLGGNRHGSFRTYLNLMLTMLLGGLWHGASWNFVLWGGIHGLALALHKVWTSQERFTVPTPIAWLLTILTATLAWVPFRASSSAVTATYFRKLLFLEPLGVNWSPWWPKFWLGFVVLGHLIGWFVEHRRRKGLAGHYARCSRLLSLDALAGQSGEYLIFTRYTPFALYLTLTAFGLILHYAPVTLDPFIYFQF